MDITGVCQCVLELYLCTEFFNLLLQGWLDDEPDEVDDPEAVKPEDWDDEEDGEWEPPKVSNPKCDEAPGCGEWKRPFTKNPAYKGKWKAPMIDNPTYQGVWAPQQIDNPEYFELEKPNLEAIAAIGIEIWTMQDGILFDNILVAHGEDVAQEYRKTTWEPKYLIEKEKEAAEEKEDKPAKATGADGIKVCTRTRPCIYSSSWGASKSSVVYCVSLCQGLLLAAAAAIINLKQLANSTMVDGY